MKIYILIVIIILLFVPIIPYENQIADGVTVVENKAVAEWVFERYVEVQTRSELKETNDTVQPDKKP